MDIYNLPTVGKFVGFTVGKRIVGIMLGLRLGFTVRCKIGIALGIREGESFLAGKLLGVMMVDFEVVLCARSMEDIFSNSAIDP